MTKDVLLHPNTILSLVDTKQSLPNNYRYWAYAGSFYDMVESILGSLNVTKKTSYKLLMDFMSGKRWLPVLADDFNNHDPELPNTDNQVLTALSRLGKNTKVLCLKRLDYVDDSRQIFLDGEMHKSDAQIPSFLDLKSQQDAIYIPLEKRIFSVLNANKYILGPEVQELEEKLCEYSQSQNCISVANGTDALTIALMALELKPGDEIITTAFSFFASAEVIKHLGLTPVFIDIEPDTFNINANLIKEKITEKTKAIIAVSLYGQCADFDRINAIAQEHSLFVIEDAAQSFGATYKGRKSTNLSDIACTSFFPAKPLGCYGDGGACFTNDLSLADKMRQIRAHGQNHRYNHPIIGLNSRLDTLQAAVLLEKLAVFEYELKQKRLLASLYQQKLSHINPDFLKLPKVEEHNESAYAQFTIRYKDRDALAKQLKECNIPTAIHYPKILPEQDSLVNINENINSKYPEAVSAANEVLSLPIHPYLDEKHVAYISENIDKIIR